MKLPKYTIILSSNVLENIALAQTIAGDYTSIHYIYEPIYDMLIHLAIGHVQCAGPDIKKMDEKTPFFPNKTYNELADIIETALRNKVSVSALGDYAQFAMNRDGDELMFENVIFPDIADIPDIVPLKAAVGAKECLVVCVDNHQRYSNNMKTYAHLFGELPRIVYITGKSIEERVASLEHALNPPRHFEDTQFVEGKGYLPS